MCLSAAKEFLSRKFVCVCVRKLHFMGKKGGKCKGNDLELCLRARTFEAVKEPGQSLDKREKCDL